MSTDNQQVARLLYELGALSERLDDRSRRFRAAAYRRAADAIANLDGEVLAMPVEELTAVPSVGSGTAARIDEIRRTGTIARLEELRALDPYGACVRRCATCASTGTRPGCRSLTLWHMRRGSRARSGDSRASRESSGAVIWDS